MALTFANEFDLNVKGWILNEPDYRLGLMAGYQESRYSFTARGGSYIYSSDDGFRDTTGTFPDGERAIGYKQRFKMPYIGLTGSYRYEDFELGAHLNTVAGWNPLIMMSIMTRVKESPIEKKSKTRITTL